MGCFLLPNRAEPQLFHLSLPMGKEPGVATEHHPMGHPTTPWQPVWGNNKKHPQSLCQLTESLGGHYRELSPPQQGRGGQAVLLECRGKREPSPGHCWGPLGTRQQIQGPEHPHAGLGQEPGPGITFQPGTANASQEGAVGILLRGPCPATHSDHVPSPSHVPTCFSAPSALDIQERGPGDGDNGNANREACLSPISFPRWAQHQAEGSAGLQPG